MLKEHNIMLALPDWVLTVFPTHRNAKDRKIRWFKMEYPIREQFVHKNKKRKWDCNQSESVDVSFVSKARKTVNNSELIKLSLTAATKKMYSEEINLFKTINLLARTIAWRVEDTGSNTNSWKQGKWF